MTYKGFTIVIVCANKEDGIYGDIYTSLDECRFEHPGNEILFGFYVSVDVNEHPNVDAPDWFYTLEDAIAWIDKQDAEIIH